MAIPNHNLGNGRLLSFFKTPGYVHHHVTFKNDQQLPVLLTWRTTSITLRKKSSSLGHDSTCPEASPMPLWSYTPFIPKVSESLPPQQRALTRCCISAGRWQSPLGITNKEVIQIVAAVKELWLRASKKICLNKLWDIAIRTYGRGPIISTKYGVPSLCDTLALTHFVFYTRRGNCGKRLWRLWDNPKDMDEIFMPRGVTAKLPKRPSPTVILPNPLS